MHTTALIRPFTRQAATLQTTPGPSTAFLREVPRGIIAGGESGRTCESNERIINTGPSILLSC